jgi:zinc protease
MSKSPGNQTLNGTFDRRQIPKPGSPRPFQFPDFQRQNLDNGLEVIQARQSQLPLLSVNLCVKRSVLFDEPSKEGTAHLLTEMLFEGTADWDSVAIARQLELLGAYYSAQADWNAIQVEINVMRKNWRKALHLFGDIVRRPAFPEYELQRIKKEITIERMRLVDNPARLSQEYLQQRIFGRFRYAQPIEGTLETIAHIERDDVLDFYNRHFTPANAALILAGDISDSMSREIIERYFASWQQPETPPRPIENPDRIDKGGIYLIHKAGAAQAELRMGHHGLARNNKDYFAVTLLNEIFGGHFLSRINRNLREEHGFTYGASSYFAFRKWPGPFIIAAAIQNEHIADAIGEILREVHKIRQEPVSSEELEHARGYLNGIFPLAFETVDQVAAGLANLVIFDLADDYYRTFRQHLEQVTSEQIFEAAQKYLHPDRMVIVVTADRQQVEHRLRQLGEVTVLDVHGQPA